MPRTTVSLPQDIDDKLKSLAEKKGVNPSRVVEMAVDWLYRCERIQKDGRIAELTIEFPNDAKVVHKVL